MATQETFDLTGAYTVLVVIAAAAMLFRVGTQSISRRLAPWYEWSL